jgi:hypothetical protein
LPATAKPASPITSAPVEPRAAVSIRDRAPPARTRLDAPLRLSNRTSAAELREAPSSAMWVIWLQGTSPDQQHGAHVAEAGDGDPRDGAQLRGRDSASISR